MKKIITIVGARPQFIKCAPVSQKLTQVFDEYLVHTGQHYDQNMSDVFFEEMNISKPYQNLTVGSDSHAKQTAKMMELIEGAINDIKPDAMLVYGDTNSTIAGALVASKLQLPIFHVEAGLRSFNKNMPEEINRVVTDYCSSLLFCPTKTAVENLNKEHIHSGVHLVGDVMYDAVLYYKDREPLTPISTSFEGLMTIHRPQNTDDLDFYMAFLDQMNQLQRSIVYPVHPRMKHIVESKNLTSSFPHIQFIEPLSYLSMIQHVKQASYVITDSGGLQKEAMFLETPCITVRPETEWVETVNYDWNRIVGQDLNLLKETILQVDQFKKLPCHEYGDGHAAEKITSIMHEYLS